MTTFLANLKTKHNIEGKAKPDKYREDLIVEITEFTKVLKPIKAKLRMLVKKMDKVGENKSGGDPTPLADDLIGAIEHFEEWSLKDLKSGSKK